MNATRKESLNLWSCCANCHISLENSQLISNITVENQITSLTDNILVWDAIAFIYGLHTEDFQYISTQYSKSDTVSEQSFSLQEGGVLICDSCAPLLSENYKAHKLFENSTNPSSFVEKVTRFRSWKYQHQSIIGNRQDFDPVSADYVPLVDTLRDDFHFEDEEDFAMNECDQEIEEKYEPIAECNQDAEGCIAQSSELTRMRELVVKLEKLSPEELLQRHDMETKSCLNDKRRKSTRSGLSKIPDVPHNNPTSSCKCGKNFNTCSCRKYRHQKICKENLPETKSHSKTSILDKYEKGGRSVNNYVCALCGETISKRSTPQWYHRVLCLKQQTIQKSENQKKTLENNLKVKRNYNDKLKTAEAEEAPKESEETNNVEKKKKIKPTGAYKCKMCGKGFRNIGSKRYHQRICKSSTKTEKSGPVNKKEVNSTAIKNLKSTKASSNYKSGPHKCTICGKGCSSRKAKMVHQRNHYFPRVYKPQKCGICGKTVCSMRNLNLHMKKIHVSEEEKQKQKVPCEICAKLIVPANMNLHMTNAHSSGPRATLKCDKCDKEYISKRAYEEHMQTHSKYFTSYLCNVCGKTFSSRYSLASHETSHIKDKEFTCSICQKIFYNKNSLWAHRFAHSNERKFCCEQCGTSFKYRTHFMAHLKMHREVAENGGEYSFKCDICGNFFKNAMIVDKHKKSVHLRTKIHSCSFCGKKLTSNWNLKIHEDRHKQDPNFQPSKAETKSRKCRINLEKVKAAQVQHEISSLIKE